MTLTRKWKCRTRTSYFKKNWKRRTASKTCN